MRHRENRTNWKWWPSHFGYRDPQHRPGTRIGGLAAKVPEKCAFSKFFDQHQPRPGRRYKIAFTYDMEKFHLVARVGGQKYGHNPSRANQLNGRAGGESSPARQCRTPRPVAVGPPAQCTPPAADGGTVAQRMCLCVRVSVVWCTVTFACCVRACGCEWVGWVGWVGGRAGG